MSRLTSIDQRLIWPHEALDFTPWLLENADLLAETLGIDLELTETEYRVGGYSLDLYGMDLTHSRPLIVENQLTSTDHIHLGQLLTYAAGTDALTIVWIATSFRDEHREALHFLNNIAGDRARFFGIEVSVVRIGDSDPAPLLKLVAEPSNWNAVISTKSGNSSGVSARSLLYRSFWEKFLVSLREQMPGWSNVRGPLPQNWLNLKWARSGVSYTVSFAKGGKLRAEIYVDMGDGDLNQSLFDRLKGQRDVIEGQLGYSLEWEELPNRRASRIGVYGEGEVTQEDDHDLFINWFIQHIRRLDEAIPPSLIAQRDPQEA